MPSAIRNTSHRRFCLKRSSSIKQLINQLTNLTFSSRSSSRTSGWCGPSCCTSRRLIVVGEFSENSRPMNSGWRSAANSCANKQKKMCETGWKKKIHEEGDLALLFVYENKNHMTMNSKVTRAILRQSDSSSFED